MKRGPIVESKIQGWITSFRHLFFKGVDLSLIVCVDFSVYELIFMTNKGYCVETSGKQFVEGDPTFKVQFSTFWQKSFCMVFIREI